MQHDLNVNFLLRKLIITTSCIIYYYSFKLKLQMICGRLIKSSQKTYVCDCEGDKYIVRANSTVDAANNFINKISDLESMIYNVKFGSKLKYCMTFIFYNRMNKDGFKCDFTLLAERIKPSTIISRRTTKVSLYSRAILVSK